jgi:chromosome segregation ATPase
MELEQILKQVDWLDEERRKDKTRLGSLEERLDAVESNTNPYAQQIKELNGEITRLNAQISRMDGFDESLLQLRMENKQQGEELEKQFKKREEESEKIRRTEMHALENLLAETRKDLEQITEIKRNLQTRLEEEARLGRTIDEVRNRIDTIRRSEEEYTRTIRLMDDGRRQDTKRLTDLQGETAAMRKRVDDHRHLEKTRDARQRDGRRRDRAQRSHDQFPGGPGLARGRARTCVERMAGAF